MSTKIIHTEIIKSQTQFNDNDDNYEYENDDDIFGKENELNRMKSENDDDENTSFQINQKGNNIEPTTTIIDAINNNNTNANDNDNLIDN